MKRFVLALGLLGCGGGQHAADEPLTADQQECMTAHTRTNAYTSMKDADREKLNAEAQQMLFGWVHDLSYHQCTNDEQAATKVLRQRTTVTLEMTGTDVPPDFTFDKSTARASGLVDVSALPGLAARADVVRVSAEPKR